ncbi:MAG: phage antirepressor [Selenomonadaceae bacterium]|nr:phage antirepressor [Selenomonadaceae bacterium]
MSKDVQIFNNDQFGQLRTVIIDKEPWFVGKDAADILGYQNGSRDVNRHVEEDDRRKEMIFDGNQNKETIVINESGLYSLVFGSHLPSAKEFKHWVTHDVLPTIRKHGAYATPDTLDKMIASPEFGIKLLTALKEEQEKNGELKAVNAKQAQVINELKPKADYTDDILKNPGLVTITQIAKDYGMSGKAMNATLHDFHVVYNLGGQWLLYSRYQAKGYTHSETVAFNHSDGRPDVKMNTKWTQKGRLFLYNLLKRHNILPVIEQTDEEMQEVAQ